MNPVNETDREVFLPAHDDPDLAEVRKVLSAYGNAASYSRSCAQDLAILVKKARVDGDDPYRGAK